MKNYVIVEGFYLKHGRTNLDLQRAAIDIPVPDVVQHEKKIKLTLGAGSYDGKGVDPAQGTFKIFETAHEGPPKGTFLWAGATTTVEWSFTLKKDGTAVMTGPWDKK